MRAKLPVHRLGWSSAAGDPATGRVYALGSQANLTCFEGDTGKVAWQRQMRTQAISTKG